MGNSQKACEISCEMKNLWYCISHCYKSEFILSGKYLKAVLWVVGHEWERQWLNFHPEYPRGKEKMHTQLHRRSHSRALWIMLPVTVIQTHGRFCIEMSSSFIMCMVAFVPNDHSSLCFLLQRFYFCPHFFFLNALTGWQLGSLWANKDQSISFCWCRWGKMLSMHHQWKSVCLPAL